MGVKWMELIWAAIIGFGVGIFGTVLGGLWICRIGNTLAKQSWLLSLSGGIMVAIVLFDLVPESLHLGGIIPAGAGVVLGGWLVYFFETFFQMIPWCRRHSFSKATKIGLLMGLGIGSHNFPEGIALGALFVSNSDPHGWIGLAWLLGIHNIPEGMVMASTLKLGKVRFSRIVAGLFLVELPMALGSLAGAFLGRVSGWMSAMALGFAGGAMLFLVFKELLPLARKMAGNFWVGFGFLTGFGLGVILVALV